MIANEFFDALPIRQFVKLDRLWKERCVGLDEKENLVFCHKPAVPNQELQALYPNLPNNVYVETSDSTISIVSFLLVFSGTKISKALLICDNMTRDISFF